MPVDTRHPDYKRMHLKWLRVRDAAQGEDAIKGRGKVYLPLPPGTESPWGENDPQYLNYLHRAVYPDVIAPTIQAMVGLMSRKDAEIELPDGLNRLREQATPDGLSLDGLLQRVRHEVLALGRYILFVDAPEESGEVYISTYSAESLINWRGDGDALTMLVFEEVVHESKPDDPFEVNAVTQWREASMVTPIDEAGNPGEPVYTVRIWRRPDGVEEGDPVIVSEVVPSKRGEPWDRVPAVIVGSRDLLPDPDQIPLLGVVNRTLDAYRQYADYRLHKFQTTQATPYGTGIDTSESENNEMPTKVGNTFWAAADSGANFGYAEISGNGLEAQRKALEDTHNDINNATMRVIGDGRRSAESGEALRLRFQSQTATLTTVAQSTARGLEQALKLVAEWLGIDPNQIAVTPHLDFIRDVPDAQVLTALSDMNEKGQIPEEILADYMRRVDLTELEDDEFIRRSPAAQARAVDEP